MVNISLIIILIVAITASGVVMLAITSSDEESADYAEIDVNDLSFYSDTIKIDDVLVDVQIADTDVKRNRGLMFQEQLPYDQGMLFIYENSGNYSFWMHNMQFSLDIIWFEENGRVVHIEQDVPPCNTEPEYCEIYDPGADALYVFETTAGFVEKFGIDENARFTWIVDKTT